MAPRTSKQLEQVREKSRTKIMNAGIELFAKKGYHSTSISQIAEKAGIAKGLMYHYFKSKTELLDEILKSSFSEIDEPMELLQAPGNPGEKLGMLIEVAFTMVQQDKKRWQLLLSIMTQYDVMERFKKNYSKMMEGYLAIFEMLFKDMKHPSPRIEAYKLAAIIDGVMLHYIHYMPKNYPIEEIKKDIIQQFNYHGKKK